MKVYVGKDMRKIRSKSDIQYEIVIEGAVLVCWYYESRSHCKCRDDIVTARVDKSINIPSFHVFFFCVKQICDVTI